jgi:hypothetical protein
MYLKRKVDIELENWNQLPSRKPLILGHLSLENFSEMEKIKIIPLYAVGNLLLP